MPNGPNFFTGHIANGGFRAEDSASAKWFFAASMEDEVFIRRQLVAQEFIFDMANNQGRVYAPSYSIAVSAEGEIVPASAVFDLEHPDAPPRLRARTPPSPFTPKVSARWSRTDAPKRKRDHVLPVIDLTGEDDEMDAGPSSKREEARVEKISPRKKAKQR
ncbi:hypothetical protein DFH09DRAFT_1075802 [Mycena vulgaris]|nr:hypothetical protein DFH09DRAFT_1075802 [Mycena vulgaris]